jgi:hypothetical protein
MTRFKDPNIIDLLVFINRGRPNLDETLSEFEEEEDDTPRCVRVLGQHRDDGRGRCIDCDKFLLPEAFHIFNDC